MLSRILIISLLITFSIIAQGIKVNILADDQDRNHKTLTIGLHPDANDGIDKKFDETEYPPMPPRGVFDVRLKMPDGLHSLTDIREGDKQYQGTYTYVFQWQPDGSAVNPGLKLSWTLPKGTAFEVRDMFGGAVVNYSFGAGPNALYLWDGSVNALQFKLTVYGKPRIPGGFVVSNDGYEYSVGNYNLNYLVNTQGRVRVVLYDQSGKAVSIISDEMMAPGSYNTNIYNFLYKLPGGVYINALEFLDNNNNIIHKETRTIKKD